MATAWPSAPANRMQAVFGSLRSGSPIPWDAGEPVFQSAGQPVPEARHPFPLGRPFPGREAGGLPEPDDPGDIERTRPQAPFVPAAVQDRPQPAQAEPGADQRPRPGRPADLVAAQRHEVGARGFEIEGQPTGELGGVAVEQGAGGVDPPGDFRHRVEHARLAARGHDGYEQDIGTDHRPHPVGVHESSGRHRNDLHLGLPRFREPRRGAGNGSVLDRRDQDPAPVGRSALDRSPERQVVRLGRPGGEHHPGRAAPDQRRDPFAGRVHRRRPAGGRSDGPTMRSRAPRGAPAP